MGEEVGMEVKKVSQLKATSRKEEKLGKLSPIERHSGSCNSTERWLSQEEGAAKTVPCW